MDQKRHSWGGPERTKLKWTREEWAREDIVVEWTRKDIVRVEQRIDSWS